MIIESNIKSNIKKELVNSKSVWIASAMISNSGWSFLQNNIPNTTIQFYLIGIDLATDPKVFDSILNNIDINARIYKTKFTFHPKVYLIQKKDNSLTAFVGSSNTTNWGLEKNVEMNFQINDQKECQKLLTWFNKLYADGYLITQNFVDDYKSKFVRASYKSKEIEKEISSIKTVLSKNRGQFFSKNHHEIFHKKYHRVNSESARGIRKEVRSKFLKLHKDIYPQFSSYGMTDLHRHHNTTQIVSRHYFNRFSGNYISAIWLHYGKSKPHLEGYYNGDKSTNRPDSFINNIRIQVIIQEKSIGIWLVLGRSKGSKKDRDYFRNQMKNISFQKKFYKAFQKLGNEYWIHTLTSKDIKTQNDLLKEIEKEKLDEYFIVGCDINWLDKRLSEEHLPKTILEEFEKLYPLYNMMKHK
jgi:hypothetical protein